MMGASRVLLATGLTGTIGKALVPRLHPSWHIIGIHRGSVNASATSIDWIHADLGDYTHLGECVQQGLQNLGVTRLHGFLHLAGVVYSDSVLRTTGFEWEQTFNVNVRAAFELAKAIKPLLASPASIVFVSSVDAIMAGNLGPAAAYGASKAGLEGLMRHLAAEWGSAGIRVNSVMVGALSEGMGVQKPEDARALSRHIALGRLGQANEVVPAIRFLLDEDLSPYVTGHTLRVDGGLNLTY